MKTLKEIYDHYHTYGFSDEQIIEAYFVDNHIEDKGVQLVTKLNERRFVFLNNKIRYNKEHLLYCNAILDGNPKLTDKQKRTLYRYAVRFTFFANLDNDALQECKNIFETNNVVSCPMYFLEYLLEHIDIHLDNIIPPSDDTKEYVEAIIRMRDN
jgi:hypothetical protein